MVTAENPGDRDALRKELLTSAMAFLDKHDTFEEVHKVDTIIKSSEGKDCQVKLVTTRTWDTDKSCYVLVCKGTVGGFSIANFKKVRDNHK